MCIQTLWQNTDSENAKGNIDGEVFLEIEGNYMTIQQIIYVLTIANEGSITKAAGKLFLTQPSLTSAVKELEEELGIIIFERSRKGVSPTDEGRDFLLSARQLYQQYELIQDKYKDKSNIKKKFAVTTQHYSFVVRSFVKTVKKYDTSLFEFSIFESRTKEVIQDVYELKSEIGVLFINEYNKKIINKLLRSMNLSFTELIKCNAYVYLWEKHPLANKKSISIEDLSEYPCLSFDQGAESSIYFAEEILSDNEYPRSIKTNDRATMLNLMKGLNAYTLCSGIISDEFNGDEFVAVPFEEDSENKNGVMTIGYIERKQSVRSEVGKAFIEELIDYLKTAGNKNNK